MRRILLALVVLVGMIFSLSASGWLSTSTAQEERETTRIERARAELQEARRQLGAQLEEAAKAGEEKKVAELKERLAKLEVQWRETEAWLGKTREANEKSRDENADPTDSRVQAERKFMRLERAMADLREECHQLGARLEEAQHAGDESKAAEIQVKLKQNADQIRDYYTLLKEQPSNRTAPEGEHPEIATARRQVEHLRAAQEHLIAGGFNDIAEMVGKRAEDIQHAISRHEAQRKELSERERQDPVRATRAEQMEVIVKELNGAIRQLREDVNKLREEVGGLRENSERKAKPDR